MSLANFRLHWYCVFDECFPNNLTERVEWTAADRCGPGHDCSGGPQKSRGIELIEDGWVYFLDDDNIIHPRFNDALIRAVRRHPNALGFFFNQIHKHGTHRLTCHPHGVNKGNIDMGQFVVRRDAIGDTRFRHREHASDYYFIDECYRKCPQRFHFINEPVTYWNGL